MTRMSDNPTDCSPPATGSGLPATKTGLPATCSPPATTTERTAEGCNLPVKRGSGNWRYRPIGSIKICKPCASRRRAHVIVKVRDDGPENQRWRYLAIVVWETARGPLPDGLCLWHINGDSLDCRLDNLEAITLGERLKRNLADNPEACQVAWAKQAAINGKKYWPAAVDARRLKAFRRRQRRERTSEAADGGREDATT